MKILLAVDGSAHSDAAIEEVLGRPWPAQSEIKVITAFETPLMVGMEPWAVTPTYLTNCRMRFAHPQKPLSMALSRN